MGGKQMIGLLDYATSTYLLLAGFRFYRPARSSFFSIFPLRPIHLLPFPPSAAPTMSYWCRPHKSATQRPIVFLHGLGAGLPPYMFWFATLPKDVGVLAVEFLPLSARITTALPSTSELSDMIAACIEQQRALNPSPAPGQPGAWDDFVLIGNSYGTLVMPSLLRRRDVADRVAASVLIDPVSLLLHLPDVAYNFTRRPPRPAVRGRPGHANEWELAWASATDPGTAHALARRFCWRESLMWREMLTPSVRLAERGLAVPAAGKNHGLMRSTVILSGEDCVTCPKEVASLVFAGHTRWTPADVEEWEKYKWTGLQELELVYLPDRDHGQGIMVFSPEPCILPVIEDYCRRDDGFRVGGGEPVREPRVRPRSSHYPDEDEATGIELGKIGSTESALHPVEAYTRQL